MIWFEDKSKVVETWVDGRRYEVTSEARLDARGKWEIDIEMPGGDRRMLVLELKGEADRLKGVLKDPSGQHASVR